MTATSTDSGISQDEHRLFTSFFDEVDMIATFPASVTLGEINAAAATHGLRFPLTLRPEHTLSQTVAALEYAPASARFGAYVDNLPGMNWELPSGKCVRLGERVIKSTTGYDLFRFLLHDQGRLGHATHYVVRLRPVGGELFTGHFTGTTEHLLALKRTLLTSSWSHWIDELTWVAQAQQPPLIQVHLDCLPGEHARFQDYFVQAAHQTETRFQPADHLVPDSLPTLCLKATPSLARELADDLVNQLGGTAHSFLPCGYTILYPEQAPTPDLLQTLNQRLHPLGGHLFGTSLPERTPDPRETDWIAALENDWSHL